MTATTTKPLCFVIMPFGKKNDQSGREINFDAIYETLIKPAIIQTDFEPLRADEDAFSGIIHKAMYERLMLCDFAIADITTSNPNVFYEMGVRHGIRPHTTLPIFAEGTQIPFDLNVVRSMPYQLGEDGTPSNCQHDLEKLTAILKKCLNPVEDSPLFQLVSNWPRPDIARLKTDTFRESVDYNSNLKARLKIARKSGTSAIHDICDELTIDSTEPGLAIDIMLSFRAVEDWQAMAEYIERMPPYISNTVLVQEQYAFALNRLGKRDEAEQVCVDLIDRYGASSETNGILGRIYKDKWRDALEADNELVAESFLHKAISAYLAGYNADIRDTYPGINAATLLSFCPERAEEQHRLLGSLEYALTLRLKKKNADYWDHATLFELMILGKDYNRAKTALVEMAGLIRESWEPKTTLKNLEFIAESQKNSNENDSELDDIIEKLAKLAG